MGRPRKNLPERTDVEPNTAPTRTESETVSGILEFDDALQAMEPGVRVSVSRSYPGFAGGWLEDTEIPPDGANGLRQYIQETWGGGTFIIQYKARSGESAKFIFAKGSARLRLAGNPTYRGTPYVNGVLQTAPAMPTPSAAPVVVQQPASQNLNDRIVNALVEALKTGKSEGGHDPAKLLEAFSKIVPGNAQSFGSDPTAQFEQFGKMFDMFERMQSRVQNRGRRFERDDSDDDDSDESGGPFSEKMLMGLLAKKFLGGNDGASMPPEMRAMMQRAQQQPQQARAPMPPSCPPGWAWSNGKWFRIVDDGTASAPHQQPQASAVQPTEHAPGFSGVESDAADDEYEDEPLSAADFAAEIAARNPDEQETFLLQMLGSLPESLQERLAQRVMGAEPAPAPRVVGGE